MDRLSSVFTHFALHSRVFFSGRRCGVMAFDDHGDEGHIHVLRSGRLTLETPSGARQTYDTPSVMFYAHPTVHRLLIDESEDAELVCASVGFGAGHGNPLLDSLPVPFVAPLAALPQQGRLLDVLFEEAFEGHCGYQAAVDRLMEVLVIQLLRYGMQTGAARAGTLAGLADPHLSRALVAVHRNPAEPWTVATLGALANMSRSRFAEHFMTVVGVPPGEYLAHWRVRVAQTLLRKGRPLSVVANEVGYSTSAALSRAFSHQVGCSPRQWLTQHRASEVDHAAV